MKKIYIGLIIVMALTGCKKETPPNIVLILADDLGYAELGSYGQKYIETPNIDQLGENGMTFSQFYSGAPVCAPARCVLLTGKHAGFVRGNDEWAARGDVWNFAKAVEDPGLEGQRPVPDSVLTIAELLQSAGYTTACIGKWGLGAPFTEGAPNNQGFDLFYGYNCQRQAHTYYPRHFLWMRTVTLIIPLKNLLRTSCSVRRSNSLMKIIRILFSCILQHPSLMFHCRHQIPWSGITGINSGKRILTLEIKAISQLSRRGLPMQL
jgi:hypothetical protein